MFFKDLNQSLYHLAATGTEDIFQVAELPRTKHTRIKRIQNERLTNSKKGFGEIRNVQLSLFQ